jgi:ATP-dependent Clp protease ATP-binding subunit ClpX
VKKSEEKILSNVQPEDLLKFGLIPEFIGRFPVTAYLDELNDSELLRILTEPEDALVSQYKELFKLDGIDLSFTEDSLKEVVKKTGKLKTGARGLRRILETAMLDIMYTTPEEKDKIKEIIITPGVINSNDDPVKVIEKKTPVGTKSGNKGA